MTPHLSHRYKHVSTGIAKKDENNILKLSEDGFFLPDRSIIIV